LPSNSDRSAASALGLDGGQVDMPDSALLQFDRDAFSVSWCVLRSLNFGMQISM
jgi:hypothetical protein